MRRNSAFLKEIIKRKFWKDPIYFIRFFWGERLFYYLPFALFHHKIAQAIKERRHEVYSIIVPRDYGKTKLLIGVIKWCTRIQKLGYIMIISETAQKARQNLRDIKKLMNGKIFKRFYEWERGPKDEGYVWGAEKIIFRVRDKITDPWRDVIIETKGVGSQVFGASEGELRPQLILLDDIQSREVAKNNDLIDDLMEWFHVEIWYALAQKDRQGRKGIIVNLGTPQKEGDFIDRINQWAVTKVLRFAIRNENGDPLWPELHSREKVKQMEQTAIDMNAYEAFKTQALMEVDAAKTVRYERNKYMEIESSKAQELLAGDYIVRILVDMAYTQKTYSDYVGIFVGAYGPKSRLIGLESHRHKVAPDALFDILWDLSLKYSLKLQGIWAESIALAYIDAFFREKAKSTGHALHLLGLDTHGVDKHTRIGRMIPYYNYGMIRFVQGSNQALIREMFTWDGKTKKGLDVLDAFSHSWHFLIPTALNAPKKKEPEITENMTQEDWMYHLFKRRAKVKDGHYRNFYTGY